MVSQRKERTNQQLPFWRRLRISETGLRIVLSAIILIGGGAYLYLTSSVATNGLQAKDLSDRLESLSGQRAMLQAEVDRLQSMQRLDRVTKDLSLVRVSSIDYAATATGAVATR